MFWVGLSTAAAAVGIGINLFNRLVRLHYRMKSAHARTDSQIARRHELVPNLVENARAYLSHDRAALEAVVIARQQAVAARAAVLQDPLQATALTRVSLAERDLEASVSKLTGVLEKYPDLRANETVGGVLQELTQTSHQINSSRQYFNDVVKIYNTGLEVFPSNVLAAAFRFRPASPFLENAAAQ